MNNLNICSQNSQVSKLKVCLHSEVGLTLTVGNFGHGRERHKRWIVCIEPIFMILSKLHKHLYSVPTVSISDESTLLSYRKIYQRNLE